MRIIIAHVFGVTMKANIFFIAISSLLLSSFANATTYYEIHRTGFGPRNIVIVKNPPKEVIVANNNAYIVKPSQPGNPVWVEMRPDGSVPPMALAGGYEKNPEQTFYICRTIYENGVHPGKLTHGRCNISWGGNEVSLARYQVLLSFPHAKWVNASEGDVPSNAVAGGFEHGKPLYICQGKFSNGVYPGKVVDGTCNYAWNGTEMTTPYYKVLVQK